MFCRLPAGMTDLLSAIPAQRGHRGCPAAHHRGRQRLKLKVNREKSKVVPARFATLLGFGFYLTRSGVKIRADPKAIARLKMRIKELTSRRPSMTMDIRIGMYPTLLPDCWPAPRSPRDLEGADA